jgi:aminoglycoside 6-adenylyltransferase
MRSDQRRSDADVLDLILSTARADRRVRAVVLSGSRADPSVPRDGLRDFDVVYVVEDVAPFRDERAWLRRFGAMAIVQFPDAMQGAPPRADGGFAILMQGVDGHRIDLTLVPVSAVADFEYDGPAEILYDPAGLLPPPPAPGTPHHVAAPPTAATFADVCNEFWWVAPYVAKGLARGELTYARHHLDTVMRVQLLTLLDWQVAAASDGRRGAGKHGRFLRRELPSELWTLLEATYADARPESAWEALEAMATLFRTVASAVAERAGFSYPTRDDERVTSLLRRMRQLATAGSPAATTRSRVTAIRCDELQDLFAWPDGRRVATTSEWPARARAWRELIVDFAYGGLPPAPERLEFEVRSETRVRHLPGTPRLLVLRLHAILGASGLAFTVQLMLPDATLPVPAIAYGDGCWWNLDDRTVARFAERGIALARFDRTEVAPDAIAPTDATSPPARRGGLFDALPDATFGALAAWAWAYHRVVDLLRLLPAIDRGRIGVTGFSRGGKAALLAGASDPRIGLVHAHASGAGGAAPFRYLGAGAETLDVVRAYPTWFGPRLAAFHGRETDLPFDQHALLAVVAPRPLLLTGGVDDSWANPEGMLQAAWAAGEAYRVVGAPDALTFALRAGGHAHTRADWARLLDLVGWRWLGGPEPGWIGWHPYVGLQPAFGWRAPVEASC